MTPLDSQQFESYVPVYDTVPEDWEQARPFLVEHLKKISNAVNIREIGWMLDEELLSGKQFIPSFATSTVQGTAQQARTVLKFVVITGALTTGANTVTHQIFIDANFTLIDMWVSATNSNTLKSSIITDDHVILNVNTITITSPDNYDRSFCVIEYIQEL